MLVGKYGIAEERIVAEGQGVGNMFEEPDWNRVSICTINAERNPVAVKCDPENTGKMHSLEQNVLTIFILHVI